MNRKLWTLYEKHFEPVYLLGKSEGTAKQYRQTLMSLQAFLGRAPTVHDLNDKCLSDWLSWLAVTPYCGAGGKSPCQRIAPRVRSPRTVNGRREFMLCFAGWLRRRGFLRTMPDLQPLPAGEPYRRAWTVEEMRRLYRAADCLKHNFYPGNYARLDIRHMKGLPVAAIMRAWVLVAWDTGERAGAMRAIRGEWIVGNVLTIPGKFRKGHKAAQHKLKAPTLKALEAINFRERKEVFCVGEQFIDRSLRKMLLAAGLPAGRRDLSHRIRRTFATHIHTRGGNAAEALLHVNADVTRQSYLDERLINRPVENRKLKAMPTQGCRREAWLERAGTAGFMVCYFDPITGKLVRKIGSRDPIEAECRRLFAQAMLNEKGGGD